MVVRGAGNCEEQRTLEKRLENVKWVKLDILVAYFFTGSRDPRGHNGIIFRCG